MSPRIVVVSGPGGVGKGTVVRALRKRNPKVAVSLSLTTRPRRPGEVDGVHYRFVTPEEFRRADESGELLESAEFNGHLYGTPWSSLRDADAAVVVLEIDTQGAMQVRDQIPDATLVFIDPPDLAELRRRLEERGDAPELVAQRLELARGELARAELFDHRITNARVDEAVDQLEAILG